jgi:cell fate regulator YaaT (PSP1 superfamily)
MACSGCSTCSTGKDSVGGCGSKGGCATGGCNRHNTYDWITALGITDVQQFDVIEVSFKNGSRKEFFKNPAFTRATTGDFVLVESASGGYDLGKVSLSGELVRLQLKRKRVRKDARFGAVIRKAHERDIERLDEVRRSEKEVMIRARAIARSLDLRMKICDVEFQGDGRKCTFYYTAEGRVDFRELIRHYARDFKVKIEMRQIGARQESARIGGLGNCGRELCCSTWLTEFKSVNTAAARYQNLAINQTKLSGMCGRLKCCLNYELDTYVEALEEFPDKADKLKTQAGLAILMKTDVFRRLMFYAYADNRGKFYPLHVDQVWDALDMVKAGTPPTSLDDILAMAPQSEEQEEEEPDFENVENVLELPIEKRKKKRKKKKNSGRGESAAAAVERAEQAEQQRSKGAPQQRPNRGGSGGQNQRPAKPNQGGGPQQRPPQQGGGQQRPPQRDGGQQQPRPPQQGGGQQQQRPPQKDGGQQQQPRPPKPNGGQPPRPPQQGGDGQKPPQNKDKQRPPQQGGKPPKKDDPKD